MKYTENYGFDIPEGTDFVDVKHFNDNTEQIDRLLCPEYTEEKTLTELSSGEKLASGFGKLAKAVKELISHLADKVVHITSKERELWNTVSNKADSNHTHKYAGSSSAGGSANSSIKLDSSAGSATQPVYFKDGMPVATTYTLGKSVPADAKFTDTTYSALKNPTALTIQANGTSLGTYDGSSAKTFNITPSNIGAAASNHSHSNYAASGHTHSSINGTSTATGTYAAALGGANGKATNYYSALVGGNYNTASNMGSVVVGGQNGTASGSGAVVLAPFHTTASGQHAIASGYGVNALDYQMVIGSYNNTNSATAPYLSGVSNGSRFVIGNGTDTSTSNAFRVQSSGVVYAKGAYNSTGADYAEYAEWADGNQNNEDRRGYFVTFDEEKPTMIRKANAGEYILGIVSGNPCIIGNGDEDWRGRYILDEFGSFIMETEEAKRERKDEATGEVTTETITITKYKENPNYDSSKEYITRAERQEWAAVGWIGVLSVYDDGTCKVGDYCKVADGGIATMSERSVDTYRVIERVSDNIVKVVLK